VYQELIRIHRDEGLSFKDVITFNLDEYHPMEPDSIQSYVRFMKEQLFDHVDIPVTNYHLPDGTLSLEKIPEFCRDYESKIERLGGFDYYLLGIGRNGHIGFNEPGSTINSKTRLMTLDIATKIDASPDFGGLQKVPKKAITLGIDSIMKSKKIVLLEFKRTSDCGESYYEDMWKVADKQHVPILTGLRPLAGERGWEIEMVPLVAGQRSVREKEWLEALRIFGIGKEDGQRLIGRLGRTLLDEHEKLFGSYWRHTFGPSSSVLQLLGKGISVGHLQSLHHTQHISCFAVQDMLVSCNRC
jgi:hypothetical protein